MAHKHKWTLRHGDIKCTVFLFKTRAEMLRCINRHYKNAYDNPDGGAFSVTYYTLNEAFVYFCEEWLLLDYISHEFFHVAYRFAIESERTHKRLCANEEQYAGLHSSLVAQFFNKYAGLPKDHGILLNDKFMAKSCKKVEVRNG